MNIIQIYKKFPTQQDCINHLEKVRWNNEPTCPYCKSKHNTPRPNSHRYQCNTCNTSFSVTVGTVYHNTKLDLQKWFLATTLVLNAKKGLSSRQLSRDIEVNKDTAWSMLMRLRKAFVDQGEFLSGVVEVDETYVGGKNKNRHADKKTKGGQGRGGEDKIAVFGVVQRDGKVKAQKVKDVSSKTLKSLINAIVEKGSTVMSDEWKSYNGLDKHGFEHEKVCHGSGEYVVGNAHTNTIEGFWSLLKRGIIGQYHHISERHINKYLNEFCFRYSNRTNDEIFDLTILKTVNL